MGKNALYTSYGTITAKLTWTGANPPKTVNVVVTSSATATNKGPYKLENGYGDSDVVNGTVVSRSGKHLKCLAVTSGKAEFTLCVSSTASNTATYSGPAVATVSMSVAVDPRFAYIRVAGHPTNYVKGASHAEHTDIVLSDGSTRSIDWTSYDRVLNPLLTGDPLCSGGVMPLGLPMQLEKWYRNGIGVRVENPISPTPISFDGDVYQLQIPTERYDWKSEANSWGSDCPTTLYGWDLRSDDEVYQGPYIHELYLPKKDLSYYLDSQTTSKGDLDAEHYIDLKYRWNDGVTANCHVKLELHVTDDALEQPVLTYNDFDVNKGWAPVPLDDTYQGGNVVLFQGLFFPGVSKWVIGGETPWGVTVSTRNWTMYYANYAIVILLAAAGALDPPIGAWFSIGAAAYGLSIGSLETPPEVVTVVPSAQDFADARAGGRVIGDSTLQREYYWSATTRPKYHYNLYQVDRYSLDGYESTNVEPRNTAQYEFSRQPMQFFFYLP